VDSPVGSGTPCSSEIFVQEKEDKKKGSILYVQSKVVKNTGIQTTYSSSYRRIDAPRLEFHSPLVAGLDAPASAADAYPAAPTSSLISSMVQGREEV
jgi:hypothetical protein